MGNFHISIRGVGIHHNGLEHDADRMAREFVRQLREAGHSVTSAAITCGSETVLVDATADQLEQLASTRAKLDHDVAEFNATLKAAQAEFEAKRAQLEGATKAFADAQVAAAAAAQVPVPVPVATPAPVVPPAAPVDAPAPSSAPASSVVVTVVDAPPPLQAVKPAT